MGIVNYKDMIVYQIYPRSFYDSDGDGIGDINGIISKLDYIKSLGVDAIWFSPLYSSPNADFGYDISNYRQINSEYGTMKDFEKLINQMHKRGLKCIMDLVVNHTSSEHQWFIESCNGKDNPYRDYYIWSDGKGKGKGKPPNNWSSFFTGSAWTYHEPTKQYYLHLFDTNQPDLNYFNPKVIQEVKDIITFWLSKGLDGFRCDVITLLSKTKGLPDGKPTMIICGKEHFINGPHIHEILSQFKQIYNEYDAFTVGESVFIDVDTALTYIKEDSTKQLDTIFSFDHMGADYHLGIKYFLTKFKLTKLKKSLRTWQTGLYGKAWNTNYFENHDQPRVVGRYTSDTVSVNEGAKMLATILMSLSGTPFIYEGQEIGMTNIRMPDLEQYKDVESKRGYKILRRFGFSHKESMRRVMYFSRDNARTPMQWNDKLNAGFSTNENTWLPINKNFKTVNVEAQLNDEHSLLNYYCKLINLRKQYPELVYGQYTEYYKNHKSLYIYVKEYNNRRCLIINNFSSSFTKFKMPKIMIGSAKLVSSNYTDSWPAPCSTKLRPYESIIYSLD